jgi:hypothetical protein
MTPKEKAKELVLNFKELPQEDTLMFYLTFEISKQCALIAVDEILKANPIIPLQFMLESESLDAANEYWQEVKQELLNL